MESFTLDRKNKIKEFELHSKDSYLLIKSVSVLLEDNNNIGWIQLLPIIQLQAELKYNVYKDNNDRFSDERMKQFPIDLILDIHQTEPVFNINEQIKNDIFYIGLNDEEKHYSNIKIEVIEIKENTVSEQVLLLTIKKTAYCPAIMYV